MSQSTNKLNGQPQKLDDVMMAMDIVDTLRHRALIVEKELGADAREEDMIRRLREIYEGQGITVPDHILKDGVAALEENRFVYAPPPKSFAIKLAHIYVNRDRWLKPLIAVLGLAIFIVSIFYFGISRPKEAAFRNAKTQVNKSFDEANALAQTDFAKARISAVYTEAQQAIEKKQTKLLQSNVNLLDAFALDLNRELIVRIISRPGTLSGVFRIPEDAPGTRNYYLIVEAVDAAGTAYPLEILSEEDQRTARVTKWGVRVSEAVFDGVKADKSDDQIIQNAQIGIKPKGMLRPDYTIETDGGAILDW